MSFNFIFSGMHLSNWSQKVCQSREFSLETRISSFESLVETCKSILLTLEFNSEFPSLTLPSSFCNLNKSPAKNSSKSKTIYLQYSLERHLQSCLAPVNQPFHHLLYLISQTNKLIYFLILVN